MKQYLKMADVFDLPILGSRAEFFPLCLNESSAMIAAHAINSHDELVQMNQELLAALEGLLDIVGDSDGVSGYHLNGDIAEWGEFEKLNAAYDAVNKANGGAAK